MAGSTRTSCRAGCSSASASRAPSRSTPRSCSSTSPSAPSIRSSAATCRARSCASTTRSARRWCSSRTTSPSCSPRSRAPRSPAVAATTLSLARFAPRATRRAAILLLVGVSAVLYVLFRNQFVLPHDDDAGVFRSINDARDWIRDNRNTVPLFAIFDGIRVAIGALFDTIEAILATLGWPGVLAAAGAIGLVFAGWRIAALMVAGFVSFGLLGLWDESLDTLALTLGAVILSLTVGVPLAIVAGRSDRFHRAVSPVLDVMQIMPTFAYLAPMALLFSIGPPAGIIATMIYAVPPAIRITALGIRGVSTSSVEAATSMGASRGQLLRKVQLPMARRTIVLGVNQTMMMALSMVVITALINTPGLGPAIVKALQAINVGRAF